MAIAGAEETFVKLSPLIESQFPAFIREEGPRFVSFLKAYYEFMEQSGQAGNATRSLIDYQDIDRTLDSFVEYFRREFMINIPKDVLADKRLLVKHIRDFYRTRGSKFSYDFLFYALFNKQIELVYPGDYILRASDGRWVRETILRVGNPYSTLPTNLDGRNIVGAVSGATARVQKVTRVVVLGHPLFELLVENVVGTFVDGETVSDDLGNNATITSAFGSLIGIEQVVNPGAFHQSGDSVVITSSGATASARVSSTNDQGPVSFRINRGGSGYRLGQTVIAVNGGSGSDAAAVVSSLSNTTFVSLNTNQIGALRNVLLNTGPTFVSLGTNSASVSANLAAANISSTLASSLTFANSIAGSINAISVTSVGVGYVPELPTVTVRDQIVFEQGLPGQAGKFQGDDAVIIPIRAPGAITGLEIVSSDASFDKFADAIVVNSRGTASTIDQNTDLAGQPRFTIRNTTYNADIKPVIAGVITQPGRYIDTKGFLSWNMRLQDNDFYQEYSYLIKVTEIVDRYRDVVKRVLHPAGAKMFGSYQFVSNTNLSHNHSIIYSQEAILPITLSVDKATLRSANVFISPPPSGESQPTGLTFSPSGTRMYVIGTNTDKVYQYKLSTAFDVSTATYTSKNISVANTSTAGPGDTDPRDVQFHPEGHTMYIVGIDRDTIYQYSLSTAWDVSTSTYASKSKDVSVQDTNPQSLAFSDDGSKMYILGSTNDRIFQYTLSTPWDVSTATYASKFLSVAAQENSPLAMVFSVDGKKVLVVGSTNDTVYQYTLSTSWDISTATYDNKSLNIGAQEATPHSIALSTDQKKMFILGSASDTVYTYQRSN
jgi:6-phosphogluconolactonase (cycloisomerase 2 family)